MKLVHIFTSPVTALYVQVDKDFQSYDVQIRVPTLAGWQAGEGKVCEECVREALVFGFCCGRRKGSALKEHCMRTGSGVRYRSGRKVKMEISA